MFGNLEEELWSLLSGRKMLEAIGLIDGETRKADYEAVMELLKLTIRESVPKKIFLKFISKCSHNKLVRLMSYKVTSNKSSKSFVHFRIT